MSFPTFAFTGNENVPARIFLNGHSSDVWLQAKWQDGEYAEFVRENGCGHCCVAMVLNLHGIKITPHEEFGFCRKIWGEPNTEEQIREYNYISVRGMVQILENFGVKAQSFGVEEGSCHKCAQHIENELLAGNQVIFWSHPSEKLSVNPFSTGDHYVLAVGIAENGKILIANSSLKGATSDGIQYTDTDTIAKVLYEGCKPYDFTWGRLEMIHSSGYVVVYRQNSETL